MNQSFRTDRQKVQTKIRLLAGKQPDQGLHCFPFNLHLSDKFLCGKTYLFEFQGDYSKIIQVLIPLAKLAKIVY